EFKSSCVGVQAKTLLIGIMSTATLRARSVKLVQNGQVAAPGLDESGCSRIGQGLTGRSGGSVCASKAARTAGLRSTVRAQMPIGTPKTKTGPSGSSAKTAPAMANP